MLRLRQHRGGACSEIIKEGPDSCQSVVAGAYLIMPFFFEEGKKASDPLTGQIRKAQPAELTPSVLGHEQEE